jgi:uncharacterized circularly permuted ATP-grasp superfamily protein/uncharacterized alpha-E superfamily protein
MSCYAVDLVREPDGCWRVLADRVGRGNGIGLAIENRRQMARAIPELFSGMAVQPVGSFLEQWQESVLLGGPAGIANPSIALLTPGPSSPHWGEHVILARELSCALVEAGDLTVREGQLWLKTVRGLRRVDVLIVRQQGTSIDPLELDGAGAGGISGLLDAARSGSVRLMNDPRAEFSEALGLSPFMPEICRDLLGEDMLLETVETLWCGAAGQDETVERILFPSGAAGSCHDAPSRDGYWAIASAVGERTASMRLSAMDYGRRALLAERIRQSPWRYVAYREPLASLMPTVCETGIMPRSVILRMFAIHDGADWQVMHGGMARVLDAGDPVTVDAIHESVVTKDVWVLSDEHLAPVNTSLITARPLTIRRAQGNLPSRAADDFFWLGRYLEQLEGGARLLHVVLSHVSGSDPSPKERAEQEVMLRQMRNMGVLQEVPLAGYGLASTVRGLVAAGNPDGFFANTLRKIIRLVPELADRLTQDVRDFIIHRSSAILEGLKKRPRLNDTPRSLEYLMTLTNDLLTFGATISGYAAENMVRFGGRQFLDLGRRIERGSTILLNCAGILEQPGVHQRGRMEAALRLMLELGDSVITYRSRYFSVVQPAPVLDLLLLDEDNPRGVGFQLVALRESLLSLADQDDTPDSVAQRATSGQLSARAGEILLQLSQLGGTVMSAGNQDAVAAGLSPALKEAQAAVLELSEQISRSYFTALNAPRLVGGGSDMTLLDIGLPT